MARYRGTVVSSRSAEDTFDYMANFANAAEWDPGTASADRLDVGEVGLGIGHLIHEGASVPVSRLEASIRDYSR